MKQWKHRCELQLLVCQPNPLRPDRVTVGFVLREKISDSVRVEVRFAKDLRSVRCIHPDVDIEAIQGTLLEMESVLKNVMDFESYLQGLPSDFPADFALVPCGALLTDSIDAEVEVLEKQYLTVPRRTSKIDNDENGTAEAIESGRPYLLRRMQEAFKSAGVADFIAIRIPISEYTFQGDLLKIDFGYRKSETSYRLLHAASVITGLDQTAFFALEWPSIQEGFQKSVTRDCEMIAVIEDSRFNQSEQARAAQRWMTDAGISVKPVSQMVALVQEVRADMKL